jgi:aminoglycoside 6'-N-acetyltransferase
VIDQVLNGERVRLRPVRGDDAAPLERVFSDPTVSRWWGEPQARLTEALAPRGEAESGLVIEVDGEVAGWIECWEEPEPQYRHASIDLALRAPWQGRGLGRDALRTLARHLFTERGHHRLTIDPAVANAAAIRAYRRAGFQDVGVMRQYERVAGGAWHDGLLMDMLAADFFAAPS